MSQGPIPADPQITRYEALAAIDGEGVVVAPACLLVTQEGTSCRLLAVGMPEQIRHHPAWTTSQLVRLPKAVLIPGLVNAHAHLDLTHIGPAPFDPELGFTGWVDHIRRNRHTGEQAIQDSTRRGIELALKGGTVAVGDIAGAAAGHPSLAPYRALVASPLAGVSFVEFFGIGNRLAAAIDRLPALVAEIAALPNASVRAGLQPHAPNTVDRSLYLIAAKLAVSNGIPLATHLAETAAEREFVARGTGSQRHLLERLSIWDDSILNHLGKGLHPAEHLAEAIETGRFLAAHVNDCTDAAMRLLSRTRTSVVYCPRASAYFGAESSLGPHRYRDMLSAGINVALGTDSIVNLPAEDVRTGGISILDEMRLLHRRDGVDPTLLLGMGTVNGAKALGLPAQAFSLRAPGPLAGLVAVDVEGTTDWAALVMKSRAPARLLRPTA
jgi:cytosine/adenosine deaminase-related metal-dependent hydrolase